MTALACFLLWLRTSTPYIGAPAPSGCTRLTFSSLWEDSRPPSGWKRRELTPGPSAPRRLLCRGTALSIPQGPPWNSAIGRRWQKRWWLGSYYLLSRNTRGSKPLRYICRSRLTFTCLWNSRVRRAISRSRSSRCWGPPGTGAPCLTFVHRHFTGGVYG